MGREAKLAIGVLLLVVAGVILAGEESPNAAVKPAILAAVFGVPGLLLLAAGLIPGRSGRSGMIFVPARLFGGLALSLAGVVVLYLYYQVLHVGPAILLVGALLAVPVGVLVAASCWTEKE